MSASYKAAVVSTLERGHPPTWGNIWADDSFMYSWSLQL